MICFSSDFNEVGGEGLLARKFVDYLLIKNKYIIILTFNGIYYKKNNSKNFKLKKINKSINLNKYILPFYGLVKLILIKTLKKKNNLTFINYLPLWNFPIIFFFTLI